MLLLPGAHLWSPRKNELTEVGAQKMSDYTNAPDRRGNTGPTGHVWPAGGKGVCGNMKIQFAKAME